MKNRILSFTWDNAKGDDHNGQHLIIGQHLPKAQNEDASHIEVYGISLDIIDSKKDFQLKRQSCYAENISCDVIEITKEKARELLIVEIDKALNILYDDGEIEAAETQFNIEEAVAEIEK